MDDRTIRIPISTPVACGSAYCFFRSRLEEGGIVRKVEEKRPGWRTELSQTLREPLARITPRYRIYHTTDVKPGAKIVVDAGQQLLAIAREWEGRGVNYVLKLSMPDSTSWKAAEELQTFLSALRSESVPVIEKIGNGMAVVYFRAEDSGTYTYRMIGG